MLALAMVEKRMIVAVDMNWGSIGGSRSELSPDLRLWRGVGEMDLSTPNRLVNNTPRHIVSGAFRSELVFYLAPFQSDFG